MAVPSSGEISMVGIYSEKNESDYTAMYPEENNISLLGLSRNNQSDSDGGNKISMLVQHLNLMNLHHML